MIGDAVASGIAAGVKIVDPSVSSDEANALGQAMSLLAPDGNKLPDLAGVKPGKLDVNAPKPTGQKTQDIVKKEKENTGKWEPDDDWDPKKAKYEDAPYHHQNSKGIKNKAPRDYKESFYDSKQIGSNSPRRIGVDDKNKEFVIYDSSGRGSSSYHGHVRKWEELTEAQKNAAFDTGKIKNKGNGGFKWNTQK